MNKKIFWSIFEGLFFSVCLMFFASIMNFIFNPDVKHILPILSVGIIGFVAGYFHIFTGEKKDEQK